MAQPLLSLSLSLSSVCAFLYMGLVLCCCGGGMLWKVKAFWLKSLFQFLQLGCWPIFHFSSCSPLHTPHCFSSWPNKVFVTENMETWCEKRKSLWERGHQERRERDTHTHTHIHTHTEQAWQVLGCSRSWNSSKQLFSQVGVVVPQQKKKICPSFLWVLFSFPTLLVMLRSTHEFFNHVGSFFLSNVGDLGGFESLVRLSERWILWGEKKLFLCWGFQKAFFLRSAHATQVLLLLLLWVWYLCVVDGLLEAIDPLVIFMEGLGTLPFVICCGCLVAFCR